jgi:hypothetical protein
MPECNSLFKKRIACRIFFDVILAHLKTVIYQLSAGRFSIGIVIIRLLQVKKNELQFKYPGQISDFISQ